MGLTLGQVAVKWLGDCLRALYHLGTTMVNPPSVHSGWANRETLACLAGAKVGCIYLCGWQTTPCDRCGRWLSEPKNGFPKIHL